MHKITKGLKKKKKGKKSKHKDEELFKPEELEAYRRKHQQAEEETEAPAPGQNEEWKKFIALTSDVDDILKKTQGDLDRIKSTSFFQRVPPPSEVKRQQQQAEAARALELEQQAAAAAALKQPEPASSVEHHNIGIVEVSESESEEEEEDDIFDTAYIDAIAAGDVKLAYIPESPTDQGDDPFDTSIAERAILGPTVDRKGKKLVPIGVAVEVLTGRAHVPTCATVRPVSSRRQVLKERDLLLGSFDDNTTVPSNHHQPSPEVVKKTLLDEDAPLPDEPIDLTRNLQPLPTTPIKEQCNAPVKPEDEDDEDFALLAAESLAKTPVSASVVLPLPVSGGDTAADVEETNWAAFGHDESEEINCEGQDNGLEEDVDPFDTAFAENILPGKAELRIIEDEILSADDKFNPRAVDKIAQVLKNSAVSINITDPAGQRESITSLDRVPESDLNLIKPIHRDLLGGSNTDLSNLSDQPLKPSEQVDDDYIEYCDPFDTSIVETAKLPGQTELKFLEKELLGDIRGEEQEDDDFDPRANEPRERTLSRPEVLNLAPTTSNKTVSFDLPSAVKTDLLGEDNLPSSKKPLTPFYVRKNSVPGDIVDEDVADPFDTSFVVKNIAPGKTELKLIEDELFDPVFDRNLSISDQGFDPRDESKVKIDEVVQSIKDLSKNPTKTVTTVEKTKPVDLLSSEVTNTSVKVLTPVGHSIDESIPYSDPFDTSIAVNIVPGRTELKLLETELNIRHSEDSDQDFDPRAYDKAPSSLKKRVDLLDDSSDIGIHRPLNPIVSASSIDDDIDPFDTSIANNIAPGRTELKILESQLM